MGLTESGRAELLTELARVDARVAELEEAEVRYRAALEGLRESEARYRGLVDESRDCVWRVDARGRFTFVSSAVEAMCGYRPEELIGRPFEIVVAQTDVSKAAESFKRRLEGALPEEGVTLELLHRRRDGTEFVGETRTKPICGSHAELVELEGITRDITDRKEVQAALRENEASLRAILESTADGILVVNDEGHATHFNRRFARMWRIPADLLGTRDDARLLDYVLDQLVHPEAFRAKVRSLYRSSREDFDTIRFRDGRVFERFSCPLVRDEQVTGRVWSFRDVTDRVCAEEKLRDGEAKFSGIVHAVTDHISMVDGDLNIVWANDVAMDLFGPDLVGRKCYETYHRRRTRCPSCVVKKVFADGEIHHHETEVVRADGTICHFWCTASIAERDANGRPKTVIEVSRDVTDRRRAAEALKSQVRLWQTMINSTPDLVILKDRELTFQAVNEAFCQFVGRPEEEVIGKTDFDLFPTDEAEFFRRGDLDVIERRHPLMQDEVITGPEGKRWMSVAKTPVLNDAEECVGVLIAIRDVTARKRAEQELRESEAKFRTLVEHLPNTITYMAALDDMSSTLYVSPQIKQILGCTPEEYLTDPNMWASNIHPDDRERVMAELAHCHKTGERLKTEYRIVGRDHRIIWFHDEADIVRDDAGRPLYLLGVIIDITQRKREEEGRHRLEAQMRQAQKLEGLGLLAGGIAHDFNNLLTGVLGNASLVLADLPEEAPERESIELIEKAALRAAELTNQMLAYSGRGAFVVKPVDLSVLTREMTGLAEASISKKVTMHHRLAKQLPAVEVDVAQIRQVIMNLLTNAAEAIGDDSGRVRITTGVRNADCRFLAKCCLGESLPEGRYVYLKVSDTGCGMDEETKSKVFDPFFTTKFTGRGLGMAATLGIVRGHQGAIKVDSEPGKGTAFTVLLPCCEQRVGGESGADGHVDGRPLRTGTVLVVDDEKTVRQVAGRALRHAGFSVLTAKDGDEAVRVYHGRASEIDAVLLDLTMPAMDGEQVFREIRRIKRNARILISSGYSEQEVRRKFAGRGVSGFIQKPYQADLLVQKLRNVIGR